MNMKRRYVAPRVRKKVELELEQDILLGSVVEKRLEVETAGHQTVDHDFTESGFNSEWK